MTLLNIQIISAFFVGGLAIASLSFVAEKSPPRLRGIVISFPSTLAVSFLFLSFALGPETLLVTLPGVFYSLLGSLLYALFYAAVAQFFISRTPREKWPIPLTLIFASCAWVVIPLIAIHFPQRLGVALPVYLLGVVILQAIFTRFSKRFSSPPVSHHTTLPEFALRVCFAGTIISSSLIFAKTLGPFWGAVVGGTYPAAYGSQFMIFQAKYPANFLPSLVRTAPIGVTSVALYAFIVPVLYPHAGYVVGTLLGFLASLSFSLLAAKVLHLRLGADEQARS